MDKILSVAMQCNTRLKLKALRTICLMIVVLAVLVSLIAFGVLNTIVSYNEANVTVNSSSVNVELGLDR